MINIAWEKEMIKGVRGIEEVDKKSIDEFNLCAGKTATGFRFFATWTALPGGNYVTLTIKGPKDSAAEELIKKFEEVVGENCQTSEAENKIICEWCVI